MTTETDGRTRFATGSMQDRLLDYQQRLTMFMEEPNRLDVDEVDLTQVILDLVTVVLEGKK